MSFLLFGECGMAIVSKEQCLVAARRSRLHYQSDSSENIQKETLTCCQCVFLTRRTPSLESCFTTPLPLSLSYAIHHSNSHSTQLSLSPHRYRSILQLVKPWYDEVKDYSFPYPRDCNPRCPLRCYGPMCTHYTQVNAHETEAQLGF